jgi:hypothetical protein
MVGVLAAFPLMAQSVDAVFTAARGEGLVRFVVGTCFQAGSPEQRRLNALSARYIRSLSSASSIPVGDLEKRADEGLASAKSTKKLSGEQCKKGLDATVKLLNDRDSGLAR